jgi:hypothetical protein
VLWLISLLKETREERPLKGILWFGVAMMTLCAIGDLLYDTSLSGVGESQPH